MILVTTDDLGIGDNYPVRPTDPGFDVAVQYKSGGVGELSDYWGNDYFDNVYFVNKEPTRFSGYYTDISFEQAMKLITEPRDQPCFVNIPTKAPHGLHFVEVKYAAPKRHLRDCGEEIVFGIWLDAGKTLLTNDFIEGEETYSVYYNYISAL